MAEEMVTMKWATEYADQNYKEGLVKGYKDATERAIKMALFNIPYICPFDNTPARLVGIVIPEKVGEGK
jgi:hypothetical protein